MRLIDADALFEDLIFPSKRFERGLRELISDAPTIDAVPVVRCGECIHRDPEDHKCDSGRLERAGCVFPVDDDYFCKHGQRRKDGDGDG